MHLKWCKKPAYALNPCPFREAWPWRQILRTQSPLPGSSTCSTGSWSTQQCTPQWGERYWRPGIIWALLATIPADTRPSEWPRWELQSIPDSHTLRPRSSTPCLSSKPGFLKQQEWLHGPSFHPSLLTALLNSFWTCQMIWNWGRRLRTSSYNFHKLYVREIGQYPCVISCLAAARCPSTMLLSTKQCVCSCREDAVSYGVIWDKEGTAGINAEEWGEQMQWTSILPNPPSLVWLLMETWGGYLAYRRNPQGKAYPSQNSVLHLPFRWHNQQHIQAWPQDTITLTRRRSDGSSVQQHCLAFAQLRHIQVNSTSKASAMLPFFPREPEIPPTLASVKQSPDKDTAG